MGTDNRPAGVSAIGRDHAGRQSVTSLATGAAPARLRRTHRRRSTARVAVGVVAAAVFAAGCGLIEDLDTAGSAPTRPPSSTVSSPTGTGPIDTTNWTTYTSDQYGFEVGHPPDWTVLPAGRSWRDADARGRLSPARDTFLSPADAVRVSAWQVPLDPGSSMDSSGDVAAWVEEYCEGSSSRPCTGIEDRAVELCSRSGTAIPAGSYRSGTTSTPSSTEASTTRER